MVRFSNPTSSLSPFTGDAKVKVIDAKSAQARTRSAKRDMESWIGLAQWKDCKAGEQGRELDKGHFEAFVKRLLYLQARG